ncbi:MAG TPA: TlpA disulfide reductase family protein [Thermomicrobiaceae bacterium]|nr:TlpA disulfide reductase family protein [Thermomicrobiaceae bacterium]
MEHPIDRPGEFVPNAADRARSTDDVEAGLSDSPTSGTPLRNRVIPAITVVIIVCLLGALAYTLFRPQPADIGSNGHAVHAGGAQLIAYTNRKAPNFTLKDLNGKPISLDQFHGKTIILNFWASWCQPCQDEAGVMEQISTNLNPSQYVLIGVNIWDTNSNASSFIQQHGLTYQNVVDPNGATTINYGVTGVPETFFISPSGMMLGKAPGQLTNPDQVQLFLQELSRGRQ